MTSVNALFVQIDLGDFGRVPEALTGIDDKYDAVVHLAAIPAPGYSWRDHVA